MRNRTMSTNPMNNTIKYIEMRMEMLREELAKNPSDENKLIINHSIGELTMVLQLLKKRSNDEERMEKTTE